MNDTHACQAEVGHEEKTGNFSKLYFDVEKGFIF